MKSVSNSMLTNKILMLSLISMSAREGWLGITKLQKLSFLTEYYFSEQEKRAFDYDFFMYDLGPISAGVYDDYQNLLNEELVASDEAGTRLTDIGESIYEQFGHLVPKDINSAMRQITEKYAGLSTNELVEVVHKMRIRLPDGIAMVIEDIPKNTTVLPKPVGTLFKIGKEYIETFRVLCDKPLMKKIREARKKGVKTEPYVPLA